jgi:hypothetical protein
MTARRTGILKKRHNEKEKEDRHYEKETKRHDDKGKDRKDNNIKRNVRFQRHRTGMMTARRTDMMI